MKIILVNDYGYQLGGAETHFFALAELLKIKHQVLTVTSDYQHEGKIIISDRQVSSSGNFFNIDSSFNIKNYFQFRKIINEFKPDVIHYHNIFYQLSPSVICVPNGIRRIMTLHDYYLICNGQKINKSNKSCSLSFAKCKCCKIEQKQQITSILKNYSARYFAKDIDFFIAPSAYLNEQFIINNYSNTYHLPHFISIVPNVENYIDHNSEKYFLYIGRLVKQKGIDLIIKAFHGLSLENIKLFIAGDGNDRDRLANLVKEYNLENKIFFLGRVEGVKKQKLIANCIANLLPSRWPEVAGLTIYEAASFGRPTIASNVGGVKDFIKNDNNGILISEEDENGWGNSIRGLAECNQLKANILGKEALNTTYDYSADNYLKDLNMLYAD